MQLKQEIASLKTRVREKDDSNSDYQAELAFVKDQINNC